MAEPASLFRGEKLKLVQKKLSSVDPKNSISGVESGDDANRFSFFTRHGAFFKRMNTSTNAFENYFFSKLASTSSPRVEVPETCPGAA